MLGYVNKVFAFKCLMTVPSKVCLYTSSKLSLYNLNFALKVKVMGSNPGYLFKHFLLYNSWFLIGGQIALTTLHSRKCVSKVQFLGHYRMGDFNCFLLFTLQKLLEYISWFLWVCIFMISNLVTTYLFLDTKISWECRLIFEYLLV